MRSARKVLRQLVGLEANLCLADQRRLVTPAKNGLFVSFSKVSSIIAKNYSYHDFTYFSQTGHL